MKYESKKQSNIEKVSFYGSSNIGVYIYVNDFFALVPLNFPKKHVTIVERVLKVPVIKCKIYDSDLIGIFVTGNNKGILVPKYASDEEILFLKNEIRRNIGDVIEIKKLNTLKTALGNLILSNDHGAIISKELPISIIKDIENTLDVEVVQRNIADMPLIGAISIATNKGFLVYPLVTNEEINILSRILSVNGDVGTVNRGSPYLKAGLIANSRGILIGEDTTGPEIMRVIQVLS